MLVRLNLSGTGYGFCLVLYSGFPSGDYPGSEELDSRFPGMWEVPLETQQSEAVINNIMDQTTKPELAQYLHAALFIPTTASLIKAIKKGLLNTCPGLTKILSRSILKNQVTHQ